MKKIRNNVSEVFTEEKDIVRIIIMFFQNLYDTGSVFDLEEATTIVVGHVTDEMKDLLSKEFISEEVHKALKHMHPLKAPGVDGLQTRFSYSWH